MNHDSRAVRFQNIYYRSLFTEIYRPLTEQMMFQAESMCILSKSAVDTPLSPNFFI